MRDSVVTREIDVSPLDIGADQFYVEPVTNICSLLPLCQQTFYGRLQDTNKRSVRSHSRTLSCNSVLLLLGIGEGDINEQVVDVDAIP